MTRKCPACGNEMTIIKRFCLCPECGFSCELEQNDKQKLYSSRYVFISYGHDSFAPLATRLRDDLRARGHYVWTDLELKVGDDWEVHIESALEDTISHKPNGCFMLLMSQYSVRRPDGYCLNELAKAVRFGLFTIPVKVVSEIEPPLSIARIQYLDMSECYSPDFCEVVYKRQLELLIKAIEQDSIDFDGVQARLYNLLKPIEFKSEISKHMKFFTGRQWILNQIRAWLDDKNGSRVFWLAGGPGVGKTAISIWLSCKVLPEIHAWHLCQHSDSITSNPKNCILSLSYYLSTHLPEYFIQLKQINLEEIINLNEVNVNTLFMRLLVEPLNSIAPQSSPVVILIDAIDEANTENGDNPLAKFIGMNFAKFPSWIRFIITSRPVYEVKRWLKQLHPTILEASDVRNLEDIRQYVIGRLQKSSYSVIELRDIADSIVEKSEGVFLYAEFICDSIESGEINPYAPNEFPLGLYNVYEDYFERRFPLQEQYDKEVAPLLKLIVTAREPLCLNEILVYLNHLNPEWDEDFLSKIIKQLGSLFIVDNDVIIPFHKSICDWLTSDSDSRYYISRKKGHQSIIEWSELFKEKYSDIPKYFLKYLCYHLFQANYVDTAIELLTNRLFFDQQMKCLNYDLTISIYFHNLKEAYLKQTIDMQSIYNSNFFLNLLDCNRRYFLDNGYFLDLDQMDFQKTVELLMTTDSFCDSSYVGILYYLYAMEQFESVKLLTEKVFQVKEQFIQVPSTTKSQLYEVYGLSLRKLGLFKEAKVAFEATSIYGKQAEDPYQISLGYANLAKIYYHQIDFESAYSYNQLAFDYLAQSLDIDSSIHGSKTGIQLFMAEYKRLAAECYIWGGEYDKAEECFKYIDSVYTEIQMRDRYYVRFLYSSALCSICKGEIAHALDLLSKAEPLCRNHYDKATVFYYEAIIVFVYGDYCGHQIKNRIGKAIELFESINSIIELTEVRILSSMMSDGKNCIFPYDSSNVGWFEYIFEYFKKLFENNYENKNSWKWWMDTDSEQGYMCISTQK